MSVRDKIRIMVVDDMSTSRGMVIAALESFGVQNISFARDGEEALAAIGAAPVHLVICDYNMPKMDGLKLLEHLRANAATQGVGFILITGSEDKNVVTRGAELRMNNFIKKPVTPQNLRQSIEKVVGAL